MVGLVVCGAVSACLAHDVVVPPWRGSAFSTFQDWRFSTSSNPAAAEVLNNPHGNPSAAITVRPYGSGWLNQIPGLGTMTGYWDLGSAGTIQFTVPNPPSIPGASAGWVSVQTTYFEDLMEPPTVDVPGAVKVRADSRVVEDVPTGGQWLVEQTLWRFAPCPTSVTAMLTSSNSPFGSVVDETVVDTCRVAIVSGVGAAKQLPDGAQFELAGAVVTRAFGTFFYVEDANRVAGIRVDCISTQPAPTQGTAPYIIGTIKTTTNGERVIDQAVTYGQNQLTIPGALCVVARSISSGLSPMGLLVKLAGRASVSSPTVFTLNDGSGLTVRVQLSGIGAPEDGRFVSVSGALGADITGPILRVNSSDMLTVY